MKILALITLLIICASLCISESALAVSATVTDTSGRQTEVHNLNLSLYDCPLNQRGWGCGPDKLQWFDHGSIKMKSGKSVYTIPFDKIDEMVNITNEQNVSTTELNATFVEPVFEVTAKSGESIKGTLLPVEYQFHEDYNITRWYFRGETNFGEFSLPVVEIQKVIFTAV